MKRKRSNPGLLIKKPQYESENHRERFCQIKGCSRVKYSAFFCQQHDDKTTFNDRQLLFFSTTHDMVIPIDIICKIIDYKIYKIMNKYQSGMDLYKKHIRKFLMCIYSIISINKQITDLMKSVIDNLYLYLFINDEYNKLNADYHYNNNIRYIYHQMNKDDQQKFKENNISAIKLNYQLIIEKEKISAKTHNNLQYIIKRADDIVEESTDKGIFTDKQNRKTKRYKKIVIKQILK